jgi:PAS domain S-box-containing protein
MLITVHVDPTQPMRILIVASGEAEYLRLCDLLAAGHKPPTTPLRAIGSEEGLRAIETEAPDLCLIEDPLGTQPTIDFLHAAEARGIRVPIILLARPRATTGNQEARSDGAANYFVKDTVTASLLEQAIRHALQRQRLDDLLRENEDRYRLLLEQAADGILVMDGQGQLVEANATAGAMLGYTSEDLLRLGMSDIVTLSGARAPTHQADLRAGKTVRMEALMRRQDGTRFPAEISAKMLNGGRFQGIVRDITERKQMDERIRASERLEALGRVSAGVAHEFNNILTGIMGRIDLLALQVQDPDEAAALRTIQQTVDEGAVLVQRIQTFARLRKPGVFTSIPVIDLVNEAVALTEPRWRRPATLGGAAIALLTELEHGLIVAGDPAELREVLTNLILNAVDALPQGGQIVIHTELQGDEVVLTVCDTGEGIPPAVQERIFEPFVSTKVSGSGLGLAVVKDIIQRHGGSVGLVTQPCMGTLFTIRLPQAAAGSASPISPFAEAGPAGPSASSARTMELPPTVDLRQLAHDLRGPLTYVVGYAELLHTRNLPPESVKQIAGEVLQQALRLSDLIARLGTPAPPGSMA